MKQVYLRRKPSREESLTAALLALGLGAAVAAAAFYLTRTLLSREEIPSLPAETSASGEGGAEDRE